MKYEEKIFWKIARVHVYKFCVCTKWMIHTQNYEMFRNSVPDQIRSNLWADQIRSNSWMYVNESVLGYLQIVFFKQLLE